MRRACEPRTELRRIEFLLSRDGPAATQVWVKRTLALYRKELADASSFVGDTTFRPRFEQSVREFEEWLKSHKSSRIR